MKNTSRYCLALLTCLFTVSVTPAQLKKPIYQGGRQIDLGAPIPFPDTNLGGKSFKIDIDYSQAPDLKDWAKHQLRPTLEKWYGKILHDLPTKGFVAPQRYTVTISTSYQYIAFTTGTSVTVGARWLREELAKTGWNESLGALVHESVHVAQQYGRVKGPNQAPVWVREGIADYIRWEKYESPDHRRKLSLTKPNGQPASYLDGYHTAASFLLWIQTKYDPKLIVKLNTTGRQATYTPAFWTNNTGKSVEDLWTEFAATIQN